MPILSSDQVFSPDTRENFEMTTGLLHGVRPNNQINRANQAEAVFLSSGFHRCRGALRSLCYRDTYRELLVEISPTRLYPVLTLICSPTLLSLYTPYAENNPQTCAYFLFSVLR